MGKSVRVGGAEGSEHRLLWVEGSINCYGSPTASCNRGTRQGANWRHAPLPHTRAGRAQPVE